MLVSQRGTRKALQKQKQGIERARTSLGGAYTQPQEIRSDFRKRGRKTKLHSERGTLKLARRAAELRHMWKLLLYGTAVPRAVRPARVDRTSRTTCGKENFYYEKCFSHGSRQPRGTETTAFPRRGSARTTCRGRNNPWPKAPTPQDRVRHA